MKKCCTNLTNVLGAIQIICDNIQHFLTLSLQNDILFKKIVLRLRQDKILKLISKIVSFKAISCSQRIPFTSFYFQKHQNLMLKNKRNHTLLSPPPKCQDLFEWHLTNIVTRKSKNATLFSKVNSVKHYIIIK